MIDVIATAMPVLAATVPPVIKEYVLPIAQAVWTITYYIGIFVIVMLSVFIP
jgi:hypothetical protein